MFVGSVSDTVPSLGLNPILIALKDFTDILKVDVLAISVPDLERVAILKTPVDAISVAVDIRTVHYLLGKHNMHYNHYQHLVYYFFHIYEF